MARQKRRTLIFSFDKTTDAMAMEKFCIVRGLPGRLIPVPREITAGCGLAWKADPVDEEKLLLALNEAELMFSGKFILDL